MSPRPVTKRVEASVEIVINDYDGVLDRYIGPNPIAPIYANLTDADAIYEHFAYNAIVNGVKRANRLDGWADLADDAATFAVVDVDPL